MRQSRLFRLIVLSVVLCCTSAAAASSTAHAWTTNGPLNFTASAGSMLYTIHNPSPVGLTCTGSGATGSVNASSTVTPFNAATVNLTFWACNGPGVLMQVTCQPAQLWLTSYATPVATGEIRRLNCTFVSGTCRVTFVGTGPNGRAFFVTYNNNTRQLSLLNPSPPHAQQQTLTAVWPGGCVALFGNGAGGSSAANWSNLTHGPLVYTMTSTPAPSFTNP